MQHTYENLKPHNSSVGIGYGNFPILIDEAAKTDLYKQHIHKQGMIHTKNLS